LKSAKLLFREVHMPIVKQRIKIKSSIQKKSWRNYNYCVSVVQFREVHTSTLGSTIDWFWKVYDMSCSVLKIIKIIHFFLTRNT
jgi:hypothetical protein